MLGNGKFAVFFRIIALFIIVIVPVQAQNPVYVAATWSDSSVHFLDGDLNSTGSFSTSSNPNGIATDGTLIYTGHFSPQEVVAYNLSGIEQFRWSGALGGLQGMEFINGELAIYQNSTLEFYGPSTGVLNSTIPLGNFVGAEGLAYDGQNLWLITSTDIEARSIADGSLIRSIPNPASGCVFGGTGLTYSAPNQLTAACANGDWFHLSTVDGTVIDSGNNTLNMYGLKFVSAIDPTPPAPPVGSYAVPVLPGIAMPMLIAMLIVAFAGFRRKLKR